MRNFSNNFRGTGNSMTNKPNSHYSRITLQTVIYIFTSELQGLIPEVIYRHKCHRKKSSLLQIYLLTPKL